MGSSLLFIGFGFKETLCTLLLLLAANLHRPMIDPRVHTATLQQRCCDLVLTLLLSKESDLRRLTALFRVLQVPLVNRLEVLDLQNQERKSLITDSRGREEGGGGRTDLVLSVGSPTHVKDFWFHTISSELGHVSLVVMEHLP